MICTVIHNKNFEQIQEALELCEMAEIRLDSCRMSSRELQECFSSDVPLIATCRVNEVMASEPSLQDESLTPQSREIKAAQIAERRLCQAIEAGARYVDVEIEAPKQMSKRVRNVAHENGTVFIRSYHDFEGTASVDALRTLVVKCHYHGADMVKIATMASSQEDAERVLSLYEWCGGMAGTDMENLSNGGLVAFCMGEEGRGSRLECLRRGAPFTYVALDGDEAVAPGQWTMSQMMSAVYEEVGYILGTKQQGNCARYHHVDPLPVPCSKSFAQRAIIAAALADGVSHLSGYTPCGDSEAALSVARTLGADVQQEDSMLTIKGIGASLGSLGAHASVHVGESGLLARMIIPLMAQLCEGPVEITGEKTLLKRPLTGAREILEAVGCSVKEILRSAQDDKEGAQDDKGGAQGDMKESLGEGAGAHADAVRVPLTVEGPLKSGGRVDISGKHGSQLITGLLMALPFAQKNTTLVVSDPKSIPYIFITLEVLKKFGVKISNEMLGGRDFLESDGDWSLCTEMVFKVRGGQRLKATDINLEGDWSAAANFLVAGAVFGKLEVEGLDTTSLQADLSIMDILMDAGASLSQVDGARGNIAVQRAPLRAFNVDASNCPDLFPIISVLAAFCQGTSRIAGLGRLANKESDRAKAIVDMLTRMGVNTCIEGDELVIEGHSLAQRLLNSSSETSGPGLLKGGEFTSHHDHRMVMALKVASLGADSPIFIDDEACVSKSFPQFLDMFGVVECNK